MIKRVLIYVALMPYLLFGYRAFRYSHAVAANHQNITYMQQNLDTNPTEIEKDAEDALQRAQDAINFVNTLSGILGAVLASLTLIAGILSFLGFQSYYQMKATQKNMRQSLKEMKENSAKTRKALIYIGVGDRLLSQKNIEEALETYKKAGLLLPEDEQIQYELGRIYSLAGDYDAAILAFENIQEVSDTKEKAKILKELALAYRRRSENQQQNESYQKAIDYLQQSILLNSEDADLFAILGGLSRRQEKYDIALEMYMKAWKIQPAFSYALSNIASIYWYLENYSESLIYFNYTEIAATLRIKQGQTEECWNYYDLALAQLIGEKQIKAKETYITAIDLTSSKIQLDAVLSNLYFLQKAAKKIPTLDETIKLLEENKKKFPR